MRRFLDQRLKLHLLRVADALETHRSLLKASAVLGIGQPALTRSLQELEALTGERLFDRHPRGVRPTAAGLVMVRLARRILAETRRAEEELDRLASPGTGSVAVGALPVAAVGVLPGALIRLRATHPALQIRIQQGRMEDLLPALAAGEIDLILGRLYAPAVADGYLREALWEEPISILARAGHPILAAPSAEALRACELVLPTISQRVGQEIDALLGALGLSPALPMRSSSYGFIREMLLATDMVSVMPRLMMAGDLLRGSLRVVPLPVPAPPRPAGLVLPRDRPLPAAGLAFVAALRAHLAALAAAMPAAMPDADGKRRRSDRTRRRPAG